MAVSVVGFFLILAMAGYSDANYCVCNSGLSDSVLQKNIDYACGAGADCTQIQQSGPCFNPNTVRDHCNYAVNSYYQRKGQIAGSCDFSSTATVSPTPPTTTSGCVYPAGPSTTETPTTSGTPTTGTPAGSGTPATGTPITGGYPATGTPITGGTPNVGGTTDPGSTVSPGFGLGPNGGGYPSPDSSSGLKLVSKNGPFILLLISCFLCSRM